MKRSIRILPLAVVVLLTLSAWNFVGGLLALAGAFLWTPPSARPATTAAILLGGAVGLAGGIAWCALAVRAAVALLRSPGRSLARLATGGTFRGAVVGLLCAGLIEGGLMVLAGRPEPRGAAVGVGLGLAAGLVLGLLFGLLAWAATGMTVAPDRE